MMKKVVWSSKAQKNYRDNLLYLKEFWTKKEIKRFIFLVDKAVHAISQNPYIGSVYEENYRYRKYLVTEQIYLYYRLTQENEILLASFWNNYQNPDQLKEFLL
ncbi:type II toxin-antitoxin system RelE/ParE family toxin [Chryseobacterium salviniae]|nr:type II toxin-antitoxin system RelE/ParE family toxin [Chryseobacterium sp. T9W2-O]